MKKPAGTHCKDCGQSFKKVKPYKYKSTHEGTIYTPRCIGCEKIRSRKSNQSRKQAGQDFKRELIKLKGGKCSVCGYDDLSCLAVFDFHHIDPKEKEFALKELDKRLSQRFKEQVFKEIKKCILVCSNCHRKIHFGGEV